MEISPNPLSIFSWFGFPGPFEERLRLIKNAGFDAVSIWWAERSFREMEKNAIAQVVQDSGLFLDNIHVAFNTCNLLWSEDNDLRSKALVEHFVWLEDCCEYDFPILVMHVTEGEAIPHINTHGMASFTALIKKAEELGVKIAIENVRQPSFIEHFLSEFDSDNLGFCYDSSHDWLYSETQTKLPRHFGPRLLTTHFSDTDGEKDVHWLPGEGIVHWPTLAKAFPYTTYTGCIALEVGTTGQKMNLSAEEFLQQAYDKAQWLGDIFAAN